VKRLVAPAGVIHRETLALSRPDAVSLASHHRDVLQESERMTTFDATVSAAQAGIVCSAW
jgi:tRNA C32,U32 (ribose-2'-O)-methylase TrmJ